MNTTKDTSSTLNELINFLTKQPGSRPKVIAEALGVSRQYVQKLLSNHSDLFTVSGTGPNRFYRLKEAAHEAKKIKNSTRAQDGEVDKIIDTHFYGLTPLGEELIGVDGFERWCNDRELSIEQKKKEYWVIINKYYPKNLSTPIDFTQKLMDVFGIDMSLSKVWAVDYYAFEVFGKTKLGTQVMISKQTGDKKTSDILVNKSNEAVEKILKKYSIDAVAFVSPTVQRQAQLMSVLEAGVAPDLPRIKVFKVGARILIAQKTLKSLKDRILNAQQTFVVESSKNYENVLIIDDALGSGATLQEISKQIIQKKMAKKCYGLVLVASPSGYEVIHEV